MRNYTLASGMKGERRKQRTNGKQRKKVENDEKIEANKLQTHTHTHQTSLMVSCKPTIFILNIEWTHIHKWQNINESVCVSRVHDTYGKKGGTLLTILFYAYTWIHRALNHQPTAAPSSSSRRENRVHTYTVEQNCRCRYTIKMGFDD